MEQKTPQPLKMDRRRHQLLRKRIGQEVRQQIGESSKRERQREKERELPESGLKRAFRSVKQTASEK